MSDPMLQDVEPFQYFLVANGATVKSLDDLHIQLDRMDEDTFNHHVNDERNDLHSWVNEAYEEDQLAKKLLKATHASHAAVLVRSHIISKTKTKPKKNIMVVGPVSHIGHTKIHKKQIAVVTSSAIALLLLLFGATSKASALTGAFIGVENAGEVQFLGMLGMATVVGLLFIGLHVLKDHHGPSNL